METSENALTKQPTLSLLLKNKQFIFLWLASTLTMLAFSVYLTTESWYVVRGLDKKNWLGIVMMVTTIPRVLLMSIGGVWADRVKRSNLLLLTNGLRGILMLAMLLLFLSNLLSIGVLFVFALMYGVLDAFFWPSSQSLVPVVVSKQQLTRANSFMQTTNNLSFMVGPAIAGFMIKFFSFAGSFATAGILLLICGILVFFIKEDPNEKKVSKPDEKVGSKLGSFWEELKEGILYVKGFPYLVVIIMSTVVVNFLLVGPINVGLPIIVDSILKGDVLDLSYLETSLAVGMFAGATLTAVVNFRKKRAVISLVSIGIMGIMLLLLSQMTAIGYGIIIAILSGFFLSISNVLSPSLTQELVKPEMMGRVQSLITTAANGFQPLSFALVSLFISMNFSITLIIVVASILITVFVSTILWRVKVVWSID